LQRKRDLLLAVPRLLHFPAPRPKAQKTGKLSLKMDEKTGGTSPRAGRHDVQRCSTWPSCLHEAYFLFDDVKSPNELIFVDIPKVRKQAEAAEYALYRKPECSA
ncbi:hypothetical protein, partial [Methylocella silvestris]|uniref:hypothetical protein n=1 Tax=Methylocella silvestris TaxID=199596 RepID=UPI001AED0873